MANVKHITIDGVMYPIEDTEARQSIEDLDSQINGDSGGSTEHTEQIPVTFTDGFYIEASSGSRYSRSGLSWSGFVAIPSNAEKLIVKGSSSINANGYCFYTTNNISYPIPNSGASLNNSTHTLVEVEIDIPETATYIAFGTKTDDVAQSGVWYKWTESHPGDSGIVGQIEEISHAVEDVGSDLQDLADAVGETLSPCTDKSSEIEWVTGKRLIRIYGLNDNASYKLG